ncbi:uncharacterized protein J4E79_001770 [Alternaria viburni]|uniref:uncharacterized protein n=1 Tax=Alternaria viburni TaxID=566460 RepID=UPI0020C503E7|nr:uncharacterized protein J4E79_001770 [Alternaria viburni]KAI4667087.1 hypothetical protein J4E79_001770 [Alternaria viburni]
MWRPIVHSDIKDANIFLRSNNDGYPAYPDVVVSDFDVAFEQDNPRDVDNRRYQGTPGMQPPERENTTQIRHDWKPAYWDVSEKSDVWSLAMTAWALMVAHKDSEETFYKRAKDRTDNWYSNEKLREGNVGKDGVFPTMLEDLPKEYSVRLCKLVSSCLRYHPKRRPSLDRLRQDIDRNLSKLDRMYGDEIHKPVDAIAQDFKLEFSKDDSNEWALYAPGKEHVSFRKRRKRANTGALDGKLTDLVASWKSKTRDAQSSAVAQGHVLDLVDGIVNSSPDDEVKALREHEPHLIAWRFLFSSMRKRTSSEASVYNATQNTEEVLRETFQSDTKRAVLAKLRGTIVPIAIRTAESDAQEGADDTTDIKSFDTLKHAIEWGVVLLDIGGEPGTPRLREKTEMHRGMLDFLFDQPFDLFPPGKSGADEADADDSEFSQS